MKNLAHHDEDKQETDKDNMIRIIAPAVAEYIYMTARH
jgi:hypothetical protein